MNTSKSAVLRIVKCKYIDYYILTSKLYTKYFYLRRFKNRLVEGELCTKPELVVCVFFQ